jgi:hypothetical protein
MSQDADSDDDATPHPAFDQVIRENQAWLAERGQTIVGSGCFRSGPLSVSIHSDFGPDDQDKDANQDYALAWLPNDERMQKRFRLVLALGDGLTTSYRSEWASALVCSVAVRALVDGDASLEPKELARFAFDEAGQSLGRIADGLANDPEASCPPGQFISTWKYILRKGGLFQSTLTLAWLDDRFFRIAVVGDGGAVWRSYRSSAGSPRADDRLLAKCDPDEHHVAALGPADRTVHQFDCWREEKLDGPFLGALHTDGVGRGLGDSPLALLDRLDELQTENEENVARRFIDLAIDEQPEQFEDNLTLAVIRSE